MKVYHNINDFSVTNAVVTVGTFDGVHNGHKAIFNTLTASAKKDNGESVVVTFWPHPRKVLFPEKPLKMINSLDERIELFEKVGIEHLVVVPFTKELANLSSEDFIRTILIDKLGMKKIIIGHDHHFGKDRTGSIELLTKLAEELKYVVEHVPSVQIHSQNISSTSVRQYVEQGDVKSANSYLGYRFTIQGTVVAGEKIGRTINYPTANIEIKEDYKLLPNLGIYAVFVFVSNKKYKGMLYIGTRPTVEKEGKVKIEVNIFDYDEEIYDETIKLELVDKIRSDKKFNSLEELRQQLHADKLESLKILDRY